MLLIGNASNDWTKSWIFLPALYSKSAKLFVRKLCHKRAHLIGKLKLHETRALQQAYAAQKKIVLSFTGILHDRVFFKDNFADFSDVVLVKKKYPRFHPAVGGVSN